MQTLVFSMDIGTLHLGDETGVTHHPMSVVFSGGVISNELNFLLLVFRRKDLCEAKHDVVCV